MNKYVLDWLRQVHITGNPADATLAEKRWETAKKIADTLSRESIIGMLELFLLDSPEKATCQKFTDVLLALDPEFPVTDNTQELRLMAGLVISTTFESSSHKADVFALGLKSADFPHGRTTPVQPAIVAAAQVYMQVESNRMRPNGFSFPNAPIAKAFATRTKALEESEKLGDEDKKQLALSAYRKSTAAAFSELHTLIYSLKDKTDQISEECALLWWVIGGYSETLDLPVNEIDSAAYAFIAAAEAHKRTSLSPPPPSIVAILSRALSGCKPSRKKLGLLDYLNGSDPSWRDAHNELYSSANCNNLTPLSVALAKSSEIGVDNAVSALPKLCRGFPASLSLTPLEAARQLYSELSFLDILTTFT
jgi:hypothetical protein